MDTQVKEKSKAGSWKAFFRTIKKLRLPWVWIIVGLSLNLGLNNLLLKLPDTTADLLSGQLSGAALTKAIMFYVVFGVLSALVVAGQVQAQSYGVKRARQALWNKMLGMRMEYFDQNDPSDLMSAIINDASSAMTDFINVILYLIPNVYYVVMALRRISEYHWILAVSCFAMLPLKYVYALIKTYTNEEAEGEVGRGVAHKLLKANMKLVHLDNISTAATSILDILQKFIVVVIAVVLLQQGKIDIAMWLAFFLFAQNLFPTMDDVFDLWIRIKGMYGTFFRSVEIMDGQDEDAGATKPFPQTGDIRFENITFTYPGTSEPALKQVSFTVPRGSCVAIVGLCGSGKTTSVSLLERFYTPDEGRILIGDTDICDIALSDFRRHLAYVQQGADVFSGTLREALTYGIDREVTDEEIFAAAEKTGFNEYLALCDNDLNTEVASGGGSMSGGQSQRLVLTREVLRGGDIILMDEPTSALDVRVSAKIQNTMDTLFADKTRILITHDLGLAKNYDRILVMDSGELVGDGTHASLLETCDTYRKMNENAGEATV